MAPISPPLSQPIPRKRSSSGLDDDVVWEHSSKRQRIELPQTPPPEEVLKASVTTSTLFDDEPRQLLLRSVALALQHVGFASASPEALESLCAEVDECQSSTLVYWTISVYRSWYMANCNQMLRTSFQVSPGLC